MVTITEGSLRFHFPKPWTTTKFDDWSFYRNQFLRIEGSKGIDILAQEKDTLCWLIEIKDYRTTRETKFEFLAQIVAYKVRDTLACLVAAKLNGNEATEKAQAIRALASDRIRIVVHLEMPRSHRSLFPANKQRADVLQRLKQLIKAVDAHPLVVGIGEMGRCPWKVTDVERPS